MPDNKSNGYLEHFLYDLIPDLHQIAKQHASNMVETFYQENPTLVSTVKKQKAKTHAYLSLMKNPGLHFGTAIKASYFDASHKNVEELEKWYRHTFILEE